MPWGFAAMAAISIAGSVMQGQAAAGASNYNAKIAEQNATLATQNAQWEGALGEQKFGVAGLQAQADAGRVKASEAANNVDVNSGSAVGVQQSQRQAALLNQANIRSNAARQAYGYEAQSTSYIAQANLDKSQASNDQLQGIIGGLGGAAKSFVGAEEFGGGDSSLPSIGTSSENPVSTPFGTSLLGQGGGWQSNLNLQGTNNSLFE